MKLYNKDKNKGKFQYFTKKINDNNFSGFPFYRPYNICVLVFIMFKNVKVGKRIECMRYKLSQNMFIVKFHPGMNGLHVFVLFFIP